MELTETQTLFRSQTSQEQNRFGIFQVPSLFPSSLLFLLCPTDSSPFQSSFSLPLCRHDTVIQTLILFVFVSVSILVSILQMKFYSIFLLCYLLFFAGFSASEGDLPELEAKEIVTVSNPYADGPDGTIYAATRSLLSLPSAHDTGQEDVLPIVASPDGTIYSVDIESKKILWSFKSGPPIYSSYQDLLNPDKDKEKENASGLNYNFFVYSGDDWELYVHYRNSGKKTRLGMTPEEFIRNTPIILEDGSVTLGSKRTTVFLVDAKTGTVVYTYKIAPSALPMKIDEEKSLVSKQDMEDWVHPVPVDLKSVQPLYITRTDYELQSFAPSLGKVLWNMTVAEIGLVDTCQGSVSSPVAAPFGRKTGLGLEYQDDTETRSPCRRRGIVFRLRDTGFLQTFSEFDQLSEAHFEGPASSQLVPSQALLLPKSDDSHWASHDVEKNCEVEKKCLTVMGSVDGHMVSMNDTGKQDVVKYFDDVTGSLVPIISLSLLFVLCCVGFVMYRSLAAREQSKMDKQLKDSKGHTVGSKKKKARKPGNCVNKEKDGKHVSSESDDQEINELPLWDISKLFDGGVDGRKIGQLFISSREIAKGSNGTVVLEGIYNGRPVAVKRLVKTHHDAAFKEIQNLIASDQHPNIVRWYGVEYDQDFVYLSLERCTCSLSDLVRTYSDSSPSPTLNKDQATNSMNEYNVRLDSAIGPSKDIELLKRNGHPSPQLLKLMRDVVCGLAHLHELGIIHRDLKPQNVLITKDRSLCAKLSDMGISKRLNGDMSSLGHNATGCGSSGWQAPEQLLHGRQTRAVDLFSLGCVLFFCITGGRHPFGDHLERDVNIVKNNMDLFLVEHIPEATDLLIQLLNPDPLLRPKAMDVLNHPLFWSSEKRLSFLRDASDRVELEDRGIESDLVNALESVAPVALDGKWDEKMETAFINNIGRYRRYKFGSTRDLLRVMRNKLNHYGELPKEIQEILGPVPEGFDGYFSCRFPRLLIEVYKVVCTYCREEECFSKYFKDSLF
ncbi:serine/threonine-protein kinase/endoribonuclease IRE1a isoform X2 [Macadamia integrifolia]|uniref:serine/threonine-protein kinase/endoribonuclease IRE1a isoform X2 n=1 Tax=Macadamia integrifolia TaxID=60698 RepID=UPI001C4F80C4|nr:serine/threonine-protein kinase/endoribonuclease IRE1a isoform X2 [Macadamia integrifolia]